MNIADVMKELTYKPRGRPAEELLFVKHWVRRRNDALALIGTIITLSFHSLSFLTDSHVSAAQFLGTLAGIHIFILSALLGWIAFGRQTRVQLRHVLHWANAVVVSGYIYIMHACLAGGLPTEDVVLASVAVALLSVFAVLLSPCETAVIGTTALIFWAFAFISYYGCPDATNGIRWLIIDALGLGSAVAFQYGRIVLAQNEGVREYERQRILAEKARGELTKRREAESRLEDSEARALHAAQRAFLTEITGGIAHEISNPLSALQLRAGMMNEKAKHGDVSQAEQIEFAGRVESMVVRITRIIHGIRTVVRKADGDDLVPESLRQVIADVVELCQGRLRTMGVDLRVEEPPEGLLVLCRAAELGQVLLNLIGNAADAVEHLPKPWIALTTSVSSGCVTLAVTDCGGGIPAAARPHLFEAFYTTKERGRGTGLGLCIVKTIMENHGGSITVDDSCKDTRFLVTFKLADGQGGTAECAPTPLIPPEISA